MRPERPSLPCSSACACEGAATRWIPPLSPSGLRERCTRLHRHLARIRHAARTDADADDELPTSASYGDDTIANGWVPTRPSSRLDVRHARLPAVLSHPCVHIDIHVILSSFSGRVESACRAKPAAPHSSTRAHSSHVPYPYVLSVAIYTYNASALLLNVNASVSLRLRATRTLWIWMSPVSYTHLTLPTICSV